MLRIQLNPNKLYNCIYITGSCPVQTPYSANYFSKCYPTIPASAHISIFSLSTHLILFILDISSEIIILFSLTSISKAADTFVPAPYGTITTLYLLASLTIFYIVYKIKINLLHIVNDYWDI